jgi:hypothetical protein
MSRDDALWVGLKLLGAVLIVLGLVEVASGYYEVASAQYPAGVSKDRPVWASSLDLGYRDMVRAGVLLVCGFVLTYRTALFVRPRDRTTSLTPEPGTG